MRLLKGLIFLLVSIVAFLLVTYLIFTGRSVSV